MRCYHLVAMLNPDIATGTEMVQPLYWKSSGAEPQSKSAASGIVKLKCKVRTAFLVMQSHPTQELNAQTM